MRIARSLDSDSSITISSPIQTLYLFPACPHYIEVSLGRRVYLAQSFELQ